MLSYIFDSIYCDNVFANTFIRNYFKSLCPFINSWIYVNLSIGKVIHQLVIVIKMQKRNLKDLAINTIKQQISELVEIQFDVQNNQNYELAQERVERWRERTFRLVRDRISGKEAERFANSKPCIVSQLSPFDKFKNLVESLEQFKALLVALSEEIHMPESIIEEINDMRDTKKVFIVHGRNAHAKNAIILFLQALKLEHLDFDQVRDELGGAPHLGDIIQEGMNRAQTTIVIFTPDEYSALRPSLNNPHDEEKEQFRWQSRPNVLLEAGMALAVDPKRTLLVVLGNVELPSDLDGRYFFRLNNNPQIRDKFKLALKGTGCTIDPDARNLHNLSISGDFETCIHPPLLPEVSTQSPFC